MKQCSKCKKRKDENEFGKNRKSKDGLRCWCRDCVAVYARGRYKENRGDIRKYLRYEERHQVVKGIRQKKCRGCMKWKTESEFYKRKRHKDGLAGWCKECSNKATNKARKERLAIHN
ncbi:MAG: hypothetical protein GY774_14470 [Planctomycetes bacterium]|nr:hypothetical protein [Planctomycetota bacterium]